MRKWSILLAALLLAGCASDDAAPVEGVGNGSTESGGKEDCVDCDPDGPSAFEQLGLGDGFWQPGDSWSVAYLLRTDDRVQMQPMEFGQAQRSDAGMVVLTFEVTDVFSVEVGGTLRPAATIAIEQTLADGTVQQHIEAVEIQADSQTNRIELTIDDLFRPVGVTEFDASYPNGRYFEQGGSVARNTTNGFPYVVPNVHLDPTTTTLPVLPPELHVIAEEVRSGYEAETFKYFNMDGFGLDSAEVLYWAEGDLWPFYVETPFAVGVLIQQSR